VFESFLEGERVASGKGENCLWRVCHATKLWYAC